MMQFLGIVLRNQFNLFYRFGYTVIPKIGLVAFDGNINDETKENIIKQFSNVTPFEYDEEYLILHFEKEINDNDNFIEFEIQELIAVYPLSRQAKTSIESKIDPRIKLENPIFENELPAIETEIESKEVKKAISALWKICKIEIPLDKYLSDIGIENIFNGLEFRKRGTKADKIQNGNYWEYLIAYDRFEYYPNSTLGYFYDAGQVFAYSKGLLSFEGSGIHKFLEKYNSENPKAKMLDTIKILETEEQLKSYITQTTIGEVKQYIITPLYLTLREEIRKSDDVTQTNLLKNLDHLKKFEDSFYYAVILLGAFFGFCKFYDPYYEVLNLRFYKDFKAPKKQTVKDEQQEKINTVSKSDEAVKTVVEEEKQAEEKQTETRDEEKLAETSVIEEHNLNDKTEIQTEEKQTEINVEEQIESSNTQQDDNKEAISDIVSQYQKIIEQAFDKQSEIKLTDIATLIKDKTKQKVTNTIIKNVIKQMDGVEIVPKKKPETARRKEKIGTLFNE